MARKKAALLMILFQPKTPLVTEQGLFSEIIRDILTERKLWFCNRYKGHYLYFHMVPIS